MYGGGKWLHGTAACGRAERHGKSAVPFLPKRGGHNPNNVYGTMHIGLAEIQTKVYPYGKIGKHLFENMVTFNESERAGWTAGESWSLGDSPAVGVALEPNCGSFVYREAPIFNEDTSYRFEKGRPMIRVYTSINSRFILEDFFAKLQLLYAT